jgi:hypothetical protein
MKDFLVRIRWLLSEQLGLDVVKFIRFFLGIGWYLKDLYVFSRACNDKIILKPCLHDKRAESGSIRNEYFWQDLIVARWIFASSPRVHVDFGSRIDGFVAHVASFREVEVFDVRPVASVIPGVVFRKADLLNIDSIKGFVGGGVGYCDSISCLHVLEHIGLGRYGDPLHVYGYMKALRNLVSLLEANGTLYLSSPVGKQCVEFNANRIFDPVGLHDAACSLGLSLVRVAIVGSNASVYEPPLDLILEALERLSCEDYNLLIMAYVKDLG